MMVPWYGKIINSSEKAYRSYNLLPSFDFFFGEGFLVIKYISEHQGSNFLDGFVENGFLFAFFIDE